MNVRFASVQICMVVLMSLLAACGTPGFYATAPIVNDAARARPSLELSLEIGGGSNTFDVPVGVAADAHGNIYVMDTNHSRVQKFDSRGNLLLMWGSEGSGEGQFGDILNPREGRLAVDAQGNVYVIDLKNSRIQKFDSNGNYLAQWGTKGNGEGQFTEPDDIAVDRQNNIYVSDAGSDTVQKFDETGRFLLRWGRHGYKDGEFSNVYSVAIAPNGNVLVTDATGRIQKFNSNGQYLATVIPEPVDSQSVFLSSIAVDSQGDIYVADWYGERIVKFDPEGKVLATWVGSNTAADWSFNMQEIAVDQQGNIYLTDGTRDLVRMFRQPATNL